MSRLVALIAVVAALVALPATAHAQSNPFLDQSGQSQQRNQPPPAAPVDDSQDDDGDLSTTVAIGIGVIVVLLIGGIWFAITRDARQAAPERRRAHTARSEPDADTRATPGSRGRRPTRAHSSRSRKHSKQEQKRRKRGRAR